MVFMMSRKLAVVTGACGFVGSHMVDLLIEKGINVRATDLENADRSYLDMLDVEFVPSDLTKKETLRQAFEGADYIFNTASIFDFSAPWDLLYRVNVQGARNLCEVALETNPTIIVHWSSGSIYGAPRELPTKETHPPQPLNNYEKSKWMQEQVMLEYHKRYGLPVTVIRPAAIYGPRSKYGVMIPIFMMVKGMLRAIPGSGKTIGSFVHVRDVVGAALFLAERKEAIGEVYNIADDSHYTNEELLLYVAELLGVKMYKFHIPAPLVELVAGWYEWRAKMRGEKPLIVRDAVKYLFHNYWLDNSKIKKLGYKLLYPDTKVGLMETIKWYKDKRLL
jgi:nucleoside-diphosphate-sugar epimerase